MFATLRALSWCVTVVCYAVVVWVAVCLFIFLLTPLGWPLIPVAVIGGGITAGRLRRRRGDAVLRYVEQAVRLNLPLALMIDAAASGESGLLRVRLEGLGQRLHTGNDLATGLRAEVPELTPRVMSIVAVGEETGRLSPLLSRLGAERRIEDERRPSHGASTWGYPVIVIAVMAVVLAFLMVLIIPRYIEIFEDFDQSLPAITLALIDLARWFGGPLSPQGGGPLVPGLVWLLLGAMLAAVLGVLGRTTTGRAWLAPVIWYVPAAHAIERDRGLGDVCNVLESALSAGVPVEAALVEAANLRVNPVLQRRISRWAQAVTAGEEIGGAARAVKLPELVAGMASVGSASGSATEAFTFLRRFYDSRFSRTAAAFRAAATPATVLLLAAMVGWIALAMFVPLVTLIYSVMPEGWAV